MTFTYADYDRLMEALIEGGYKFVAAGKTVASGTVVLRHDIDKSMEVALEMATREHARGVLANYYFLLRSPLYSLLEPESIAHVHEIASMGHQVGIHFDRSRLPGDLELDAAVEEELALFSRITGMLTKTVSFHNPEKDLFMREPGGEYHSCYSPSMLPPLCKYISDSNAFLREGCPRESIRGSKWKCLQLLIHPIWWMHDEPVTVEQALTEILSARSDCQDSYLCHSNTMWNEYRGNKG